MIFIRSLNDFNTVAVYSTKRIPMNRKVVDMDKIIGTNKHARERWETLLASGGYSIGYFSVIIQGDRVRIYHYKTRTIAYFRREDSFEGMQELCAQRGYDLPYLLDHYYPKSMEPLSNYTHF